MVEYDINPIEIEWSFYTAKTKSGEKIIFMVNDFDKEFIIVRGDKSQAKELEKAFWEEVKYNEEEDGTNFMYPDYTNVIVRNTDDSPFWEQYNPDWE
ncbi:hypothetical protein HYG87_00580 [Methanobacterium alkalithermotolerans]|uniref:Uncharacterized protein n=1 Tax=Methanobacterium alkalithermotolerans TaxID=2731220 RepID=A0A8T8K1X2_9EURY|nr:hypothetical protein [Methanobacterium alkalithermotolerans]QUH22364.1 hypothetical protein HYG87_00580 [Methanobacterium alkalithermotolerans]